MTDINLTKMIERVSRSAMTAHAHTHHEPVEHILVKIGPKLLDAFIAMPDKPKAVDGIPIRYAEEAPKWDLSAMCHYHSERLDKVVGSRGMLAWVPAVLKGES